MHIPLPKRTFLQAFSPLGPPVAGSQSALVIPAEPHCLSRLGNVCQLWLKQYEFHCLQLKNDLYGLESCRISQELWFSVQPGSHGIVNTEQELQGLSTQGLDKCKMHKCMRCLQWVWAGGVPLEYNLCSCNSSYPRYLPVSCFWCVRTQTHHLCMHSRHLQLRLLSGTSDVLPNTVTYLLHGISDFRRNSCSASLWRRKQGGPLRSPLLLNLKGVSTWWSLVHHVCDTQFPQSRFYQDFILLLLLVVLQRHSLVLSKSQWNIPTRHRKE